MNTMDSCCATVHSCVGCSVAPLLTQACHFECPECRPPGKGVVGLGSNSKRQHFDLGSTSNNTVQYSPVQPSPVQSSPVQSSPDSDPQDSLTHPIHPSPFTTTTLKPTFFANHAAQIPVSAAFLISRSGRPRQPSLPQPQFPSLDCWSSPHPTRFVLKKGVHRRFEKCWYLIGSR